MLFAEQDGLLRDNLTEVVVKPESAIAGKSLKTAGFTKTSLYSSFAGNRPARPGRAPTGKWWSST